MGSFSTGTSRVQYKNGAKTKSTQEWDQVFRKALERMINMVNILLHVSVWHANKKRCAKVLTLSVSFTIVAQYK